MIDYSKMTIGTDPEYIIATNNENYLSQIPANRFISDPDRNLPFGLDGCSSTGELRPQESNNPLEVAENIGKILTKYNKMKEYKNVFSNLLLPSSKLAPVGGHIHIGHYKISTRNENILNRQENVTKLVTAFDSYLSFPLMFIENKEYAQYRKGRYGNLSDYRNKTYGIEYRTVPSFLASKQLAQGVLSLSYVIAHEVLTNNRQLKHTLEKIEGFSIGYMKHYAELLKPYKETIITDIVKNFELYPKYKPYIDYIFTNIKKEKPIVAHEMHVGWHLKKYRSYLLKLTYEKCIKLLLEGMRKKYHSDNNIIGSQGGMFVQDIAKNIMCGIGYMTTKSNKPMDYIIPLNIEGINVEQGETIEIFLSRHIYTRKLKRIIEQNTQSLLTMFSYPRKVNVTVTRSWGVTGGYIKFGRYVREHKKYMCEAIGLLIFFILNKSLCIRTNKKGITIPFTIKKFVKLFEPLAQKTKPIDIYDTYAYRNRVRERIRNENNEGITTSGTQYYNLSRAREIFINE